MWTHLPLVEEEHREAKLQNSHAISLTHYGPNCDVHMIPQDRVEDKGGDTEEEIERFTSPTEPLA